MGDLVALRDRMKRGGEWLGAARTYVQYHCIGGDRVTWGSDTPMSLTMRQIEEMALQVAIAAVSEEHDRQKRELSRSKK